MSEFKPGVYGYVSGTVTRTFNHANGTAFEVSVQDAREQYPDKWTIWAAPDGLREGDNVTAEGWVKIRRETYESNGETKIAVRRSLNGAKVKNAPSKPTSQAEPTDQQDDWSQPAFDADPAF